MIGIIGAMEKELEALKNTMTDKETVSCSGIEFVKGKIFGKEVVIARCGIGKVFGAMCAQAMIMKFNPDVIINSGVAGSMDKRLNVCDVAVGCDTVQYDMDTTALGDELGLISGLDLVHIPCDEEYCNEILSFSKELGVNCIKGTVCSADRFQSDINEKIKLKEKFNAIACDMESGSIAHVCFVNKTRCVIIRSVSDSFDGQSAMEYNDFLKEACKISCAFTLKFIENR